MNDTSDVSAFCTERMFGFPGAARFVVSMPLVLSPTKNPKP